MQPSRIVVRYAETDQMGIAHHSQYPIWYEVARTDFIRQAGFPYSQLEKDGILLPLIELQCQYKGAAHYEDELHVSAHLTKLRRVKMEFSYVISRAADQTLLNTGRTVHGIVDRSLKPLDLSSFSPELYRQLQSLLQK